MKINIKLNKLVFKLATALFVFSGMIVFAATNDTVSRAMGFTRPDVKVNISAVVERDQQKLPVEKVDAVHAGEILDWRINSTNEGNAAANNYEVVASVPAGTSFVAGSAFSPAKAAVTYSIDNGKNFSKQPMIEERQADGSVKKVPAPASMFSHLKFEWSAPLGSGQKLESTYRVRVK